MHKEKARGSPPPGLQSAPAPRPVWFNDPSWLRGGGGEQGRPPLVGLVAVDGGQMGTLKLPLGQAWTSPTLPRYRYP